MALQKVELTRSFEILKNGKKIKLQDPNPNLSIEEVKKFLSIQYPEVLNSTVAQPEFKEDKVIYSFSPQVATKG